MDTLKNVDINIARIGKAQDKEFNEIRVSIARIENSQISLNSNLEILNRKLDFIISFLEKNSR